LVGRGGGFGMAGSSDGPDGVWPTPSAGLLEHGTPKMAWATPPGRRVFSGAAVEPERWCAAKLVRVRGDRL